MLLGLLQSISKCMITYQGTTAASTTDKRDRQLVSGIWHWGLYQAAAPTAAEYKQYAWGLTKYATIAVAVTSFGLAA